MKFTGSAQIAPGWSAGYVLQIEAINADSLTMNQVTSQNPTALGANGSFGTQLLQSYWFVKSDQLGKLSLGRQSQASDNTAILVDGSGSLVPANWVLFDTANFNVRNNFFANVQWSDFGGCGNMGGAAGDCNGATRNVLRYDSPTFGGFSVSASWGEDDMWDVAARYAGEFSGFKLAAAAAYTEISDEAFNGSGIAGDSSQYFQAGAFLMHVPTGLFAYGAYGQLESDLRVGDSVTWYGKAGLRTRLSSLGHTVFYGEYMNSQGDDDFSAAFYSGAVGLGAGVDTEMDLWGVGIVQEIDAAAMSVWVKYRNLSAEASGAIVPANTGLQDFDYVGVGGLINF